MRDALSLLTTFGRRGGALHARALAWFPPVGLALGAALGGLWWAAGRVWPPLLAGALVVTADLAATGLLHVDGLADAADGLLPHASRERRLAIMRSPDVGAFGVAVVGITLLVRVAALGSLAPNVLLLAAIWGAARSVVAGVPALVPSARESGMASTLVDGATAWPALAVIPAVALGAIAAGAAGACAVATAAIGSAGVVALGRRRLGGFTGDVLGASIVLGETVALVVAAARW
jgi:adenosylcobinamide-GDP ribazoletransferase